MCRHLAYLGRPRPLRELLCDPPHSLLRQSWAPRRQAHGVVNADGFGVGWYADGDPQPARYRRTSPMWTDRSFPDLARVVRSGAVLAAVRSATDGMAQGEAAVAPFGTGRYLFSHNGAVAGWPASIAALTARTTAAELLAMEAVSDSALLWLVVHQRLQAGETMPEALAGVVRLAASTAGGRLNLLVTDGRTIAATRWGDTLCWRVDALGAVVASEPYDEEAGWADVPDRSLLLAAPGGVDVTPLPLDVPPEGPWARRSTG
ncbi:MAG: ergothioneine biosynthesis protein EgtC [Mycobacteriales bacterium]